MIILDTGGLYAALDANEDVHERAVATLAAVPPPRILSPFVLAELDYLIGTRIGRKAQAALLEEVVSGVYRLETMSADDIDRAKRVMERYPDLDVGLADASVVVLAHRHRTLDLLSTDQRHFRTLRGPGGRPFRLLPYDG